MWKLLLSILIFATTASAQMLCSPSGSCNPTPTPTPIRECTCMPLSVDEIITDTGINTYTSSKTYTKVGNTSPGVLIVQFFSFLGSYPTYATVPPTSVTYNGISITINSLSLHPDLSDRYTVYYGSLINPPSGVHDLVINFSGDARINLMASFWSGTVSTVNWSNRIDSLTDPVVSVARAPTSALASFVCNTSYPAGGALNIFLGDGTEYVIGGASECVAATQEPSQGSGVINWHGYDPLREEEVVYPTSHLTAEIIAGVARRNSIPFLKNRF